MAKGIMKFNGQCIFRLPATPRMVNFSLPAGEWRTYDWLLPIIRQINLLYNYHVGALF